MSLNISKLLFAAILVVIFTAGALFSYLWVVGYYISLELKIPDKPVIYVHDFIVSAEDPTFFNISILNPSFSPKETKILGIQVLTEDGEIHHITSISPDIPNEGYILNPGNSEIFRCSWDWSNYTGQIINVIVLVEEGSGGSLQIALPLTEINIANITFDPECGDHFNMTVINSDLSAANVTLTEVNVIVDNSVHKVATQPALPINLEPNSSISLVCMWSWANYQGETITLAIKTVQGYSTRKLHLIPTYAIFTIQKVEFNLTDTSRFKLIVANSENSLVALKITDISITLENNATIKPEKTVPALPYILDRNSTISFTCEWNWTTYRGEEIVITISTGQGYKTKITWRIS